MIVAPFAAKIARDAEQIRNPDAERNPAAAHLFIINPLSGERMDSLFSTHPATENRIAALQAMEASMGHSASAPAAERRQPRTRQTPSGPWGTAQDAPPPEAEPPVAPEERKPNPWGRNPTGPKGPWS